MAETNAVVERALKFYKFEVDAQAAQRAKIQEDLLFEQGQHWDTEVERARKASGRPTLTIDLLSGPISQIDHQGRESRPGVQISSRRVGPPAPAAALVQGFFRNIEQGSQAPDVYHDAMMRAARCGQGFFRLLAEYEDDESDEQVLRYEWFDNQGTVYLDSTCTKQDGSDRRQALVFTDLTHERYDDLYGDFESAATIAGMGTIGDDAPDWATKDSIRVAEYFEIEEKKRTRLTLEHVSGERHSLFADELPKGEQTRKGGKFSTNAPVLPEGLTQVASRPVTEKTCCWYLITAAEVLKEVKLPIPYIPIFEVEGQRRNVNGKVDKRGVVRMAKDPVRQSNSWESAITESIAYGSKVVWVMAEGQDEGFEAEWDQVNTAGLARVHYKATMVDGQLAPPPHRDVAEPAIQAMVIAAQRSANQVRMVTGFFDVQSEEKRTEQSGKAILARERQGQQGNSLYLENRNRTILFAAKVALAWAPHVYDTPRLHKITGIDEKERSIVTHAGNHEQAQQLAQQHGIKPEDVLDLADASKYDITISVGKAYAAQRQEATDAITASITAFPPIAPKALPILFRNSDWPGAQELAAALEPQDGEQQVPPKAQQRMEQLDQFAHMATDKIKELQGIIDSKQLEQDTKLKIAEMDNDVKLRIAAMNATSAEAQAQGELLAARLEQLTGLAHDSMTQLQDHAHEYGMAAHGAAQGAQATDQQHQNALEQGAEGHQQELEAAQQAADLAPEPAEGASA